MALRLKRNRWPSWAPYLWKIVGVPLTKEQFDLEARELLDKGETH